MSKMCQYLYNKAPDKLLGQLGIYAPLLSAIVYLQKQLHNFFTPSIFVITHNVCSVFLLNEAIRNWPVYIFTLIIYLSGASN